MNLDYDDWKEQYIPIINNGGDNKRDLDSFLYHKRGLEYLKVNSFPKNNIWVVCLNRDGSYITTLSNYEKFNYLIGYIITVNPWNNSETFINTQRCIELNEIN